MMDVWDRIAYVLGGILLGVGGFALVVVIVVLGVSMCSDLTTPHAQHCTECKTVCAESGLLVARCGITSACVCGEVRP